MIRNSTSWLRHCTRLRRMCILISACTRKSRVDRPPPIHHPFAGDPKGATHTSCGIPSRCVANGVHVQAHAWGVLVSAHNIKTLSLRRCVKIPGFSEIRYAGSGGTDNARWTRALRIATLHTFAGFVWDDATIPPPIDTQEADGKSSWLSEVRARCAVLVAVWHRYLGSSDLETCSK